MVTWSKPHPYYVESNPARFTIAKVFVDGVAKYSLYDYLQRIGVYSSAEVAKAAAEKRS